MSLSPMTSSPISSSTATRFRCGTVASSITDTIEAVRECLSGLGPDLVESASWIVAFYTESHDAEIISNGIKSVGKESLLLGGSSCRSIMNEEGVWGNNSAAMGLFVISDPNGNYGVGGAEIDDSPREAATAAMEQALENSGRPDETPSLIWISAAPGTEEDLLHGIADVVGENVPVAGGSAADNAIAGHWTQIAGGKTYDNGVVITALFPSVETSFAFHSGYDPTSCRGTVTEAEGRKIISIDGRPATEVYNEWTGGQLTKWVVEGGNILAESSLAPLGYMVDEAVGVEHFTLMHPANMDTDGTLHLFAEVETGTELILMKGTRDQLVVRAERVTDAAREASSNPEAPVLGGLVVYCAGCMLTVGDRISKVAEHVNKALGNEPFLGTFTFGEQGCHLAQENAHGNLMISVVLFRDTEVN